MPLEQISQAVLDQARTEADHIVRAAQKAADEKTARARELAEQDAERRAQSAMRAIDEDFYRKLTQFTGAGNKELLARKSACVRQVFEASRGQMLALPQDEYLAIMRKLIARAAEGHGGKLRVHPDEKGKFTQLLAQFNADRAADLQVVLDDAQPLPEAGGFIFVTGKFQVDQTLRALLTDLEYELAPQIAAELFGA